jgi:hypothetical protein
MGARKLRVSLMEIGRPIAMRPPYLVALRCKLAPGMFSSERVFTVVLADGTEHRGIAARHFCWNADGVPVGPREPAEEAEGMVAARIVREVDISQEEDISQVAVEVPDGEVIAVEEKNVVNRPTKIHQPSTTLSAEPEKDVPVRQGS